ncbi:STAS/SEC14 domain-containing protein [Pseudonocardia spirodelae]|uniref:STAS/SEC14 domain-containing protein n=1 Tax=Pseudonocardia spirodelae TaxID=3133431 RepID=A0ABU8T7H3_9PSEU
MIEVLHDLPRGVFGLRVDGRLTAQDYEQVVEPLVASARRADDRLRCLVEIDEGFRGLTPGAMLDDLRLGLDTVGAYDGVAVLTRSAGLRRAAEWTARLVPFPVRVFRPGDRSRAAQWLADLPAGSTVHVEIDAADVARADIGTALRVEDFERLAATVDPWIREHGELRGLVLHLARIPGWTSPGSLVRHLMFAVGHHRRIRRLAMVGDPHLLALAARALDRVAHPEVRAFAGDGSAAAHDWAAGD